MEIIENNIPRTSALLHGSRMLKVGVIGAGRGVGTTHFALMASNYFANGLGYKTAVVECNGHGDFVKLYDETKIWMETCGVFHIKELIVAYARRQMN